MNRASAYAPGRVEILGNHTDYNNGVVLSGAIDRGLRVSGETCDDDVIEVVSSALHRRARSSLGRLQRDADEPWANYALGVTQMLITAGNRVGGYSAVVDADLGLGGGLSSSAAFEVATAYFLIKLNGFPMSPAEVARLCHKAENEFVGVASGLLDQMTSVFGRADHVVYLDCATEQVRTVRAPSDIALVIADSGVKHSLVQGEYNQRRAECAAAARELGVRTLREVSPEQLESARDRVDPVLFRRALHVVAENQRVWRAVEALEQNASARIGTLMNESHESSLTNFENSTPELDLLVSIAHELPGVLGARLTGGGFGGSTVTLTACDEAERVASQINERYKARSGRDAGAFVCRLADGAAIVNGFA